MEFLSPEMALTGFLVLLVLQVMGPLMTYVRLNRDATVRAANDKAEIARLDERIGVCSSTHDHGEKLWREALEAATKALLQRLESMDRTMMEVRDGIRADEQRHAVEQKETDKRFRAIENRLTKIESKLDSR